MVKYKYLYNKCIIIFVFEKFYLVKFCYIKFNGIERKKKNNLVVNFKLG